MQGRLALLLSLMLKRGKMSREAIEMATAETFDVKVGVSHVRKYLRENGVPIEITNIFKFGYELKAVETELRLAA
jgi:hypothetical protein